MTRLSALFEASYGNKFDLNKMKPSSADEGIAFVSRTRKNLGVVGYVEPVPGIEPYPGGYITVALGGVSVLEAFVQMRPFYTAQNVGVLKPRKDMSQRELVYYCLCIRQNRHRYYGFGREANRTFREIEVPDINTLPSWVDDAPIPNEISCDPRTLGELADLKPRRWPYFELGTLFDIRKGKRLTKASMTAGTTPFIGAIDHNNGLTTWIDRPAIHPGNTLTVNYNGNGVAEAYYQPTAFWCSDDVNVLYPNFDMDVRIGLFICTLIRMEKYRFSYGRKWHLDRMKTARLKLPALKSGTPDWDFVRGYMDRLPYSSNLAIEEAAATNESTLVGS